MTRAIMHGCNGKMGQVITGLCKEDPDIEIVAGSMYQTTLKMNIRYIRAFGTARRKQM